MSDLPSFVGSTFPVLLLEELGVCIFVRQDRYINNNAIITKLSVLAPKFLYNVAVLISFHISTVSLSSILQMAHCSAIFTSFSKFLINPTDD